MLEQTQWATAFWIVAAIPVLVYMGPPFIKFIVPLLLRYRQRAEKSQLQSLIKEYHEELNNISQVDEFAKYSKVQRKLRATGDQMKSINRRDLELHFAGIFAGQVICWIVGIILFLRLIYILTIDLTGISSYL